MNWIRYSAWAMVLVLVAASSYFWLARGNGPSLLQLSNAPLGGPFQLVRADGSPIGDKELLGKPHAMFFGFTHCPEVCPTTLLEAAGWLEKLGPDADNFAFYFVTVDPERDTPEVMKDYVSSFDPRIVGITGPVEAIHKTLADYKVFYRKVPLEDGDYTMDHTATVYLLRPDGSFSGTIAWGEDPDTALEKIRRLIKNG